jgi:hypothetical protein
MKSPVIYALLVPVVACLAFNTSHAQFFKKLKDKVNQALDKKATDAVVPAGTATPPTANTGPGGGPVNKTGGGLTNTPPPDVTQNINDAEKADATSDFSTARYALHQAMLGLEIELGRQLLQSLPATIDGLNKDTTKNNVVSTQYGWGNLTIATAYSDGKDKQMTLTIGNNPAYAGIISMYFNNASMMQASTANNPNMKQTRVKGTPAIIQFNQSEGYTVMMQLGQQSMLVWHCVNFASEDEVMNAAATFDIDGIKKMLGEQ